MKFGNWNIKEKTIEFAGIGSDKFVIEKDNMFETVEEFEEPLYKWLVMATTEEILSEDDLYDLNFAFVFAAGNMQDKFDYEIFDKTVEYQYGLLEDEEEED